MSFKISTAMKFFALTVCILISAGCQTKDQSSNTQVSSRQTAKIDDIFTQDSNIPARIGKGWYEPEQASGKKYRWTGQDPEIMLEPTENAKAQIKIYLSSFYKTRQCNVILGDKIIANRNITADQPQVLDFQADLSKGLNTLKITSPDKSQAPAEIPELKNTDSRSLLFVVWSISMKIIS
jgi:hypothetical protein